MVRHSSLNLNLYTAWLRWMCSQRREVFTVHSYFREKGSLRTYPVRSVTSHSNRIFWSFIPRGMKPLSPRPVECGKHAGDGRAGRCGRGRAGGVVRGGVKYQMGWVVALRIGRVTGAKRSPPSHAGLAHHAALTDRWDMFAELNIITCCLW